jgi:hypothetical protein
VVQLRIVAVTTILAAANVGVAAASADCVEVGRPLAQLAHPCLGDEAAALTWWFIVEPAV